VEIKKIKIYLSLMSFASVAMNLSRKRRSFSKQTASPFYFVKLNCGFGFGNLKQIRPAEIQSAD